MDTVVSDSLNLSVRPRTFSELENECNYRFEKARDELGGFWHFCTPGFLNEMVNVTDEDYDFSFSNVAFSAAEAGITVITDSIMGNHIHGLLGCSREKCLEFQEGYIYRTSKHLKSIGRNVNLRNFKCDNPIEITDLKMIRNEIVYIHRNRYVVDPRYTPFSDPWSGGSLYFNPFAKSLEGIPFDKISFKEKRRLTFRTDPHFPGLVVKNGMVLPSSYIKYELGESLFRSAHQYFNLLSKNIEAFSEEAKRLGDQIVLTSEELYSAAMMLSMRDYHIDKLSLLPPNAKVEIAKRLHFDFNASNARIQSILHLPPEILSSLFPKAI